MRTGLPARKKFLNTDGYRAIQCYNFIIFNNSISSVVLASWIHVFQIPVGIRFQDNFQEKYKLKKNY